ncbi:MAG: hypothetical protein DDT25_00073 [Chloroflexi bacterium]|nr:hypothetical protein [Chloroflexota bacterium]
MKRILIPIAMSISFSTTSIAGSATEIAGLVGGVGGATEFTQIANQVQLTAAYVQQVETALNSARQYQAMIDQLRRNPDGFAGRMVAGDIQRHLENAENATLMVDRLTTLRDNKYGVYRELDRANQTLHTMNDAGYVMTADEYLSARIELGRQEGTYWADRNANFRERLVSANKDIEVVTEIAATADGMETQIQGLSALVASSSVVSRQLVEMNVSIMQQTADQNSDRTRRADAEVAALEARKAALRQNEEFIRSIQSLSSGDGER